MLISYEIFVEAYNSHPKYLTRMIGEIFSYYIFSLLMEFIIRIQNKNQQRTEDLGQLQWQVVQRYTSKKAIFLSDLIQGKLSLFFDFITGLKYQLLSKYISWKFFMRYFLSFCILRIIFSFESNFFPRRLKQP